MESLSNKRSCKIESKPLNFWERRSTCLQLLKVYHHHETLHSGSGCYRALSRAETRIFLRTFVWYVHSLKRDEDGRERCTACASMRLYHAPAMEGITRIAERKPGRRKPKNCKEENMLRCKERGHVTLYFFCDTLAEE